MGGADWWRDVRRDGDVSHHFSGEVSHAYEAEEQADGREHHLLVADLLNRLAHENPQRALRRQWRFGPRLGLVRDLGPGARAESTLAWSERMYRMRSGASPSASMSP